MALDAIFFDFFGTLIDYEPEQGSLTYPKTYERVQSWGFDQNYEAFVSRWEASFAVLEAEAAVSLVEFDMLDAAMAFGRASGLDLDTSRGHGLATAYIEEWQEHLEPAPGAISLVKRLADRSRIGIVSNTHDRLMVPSILAQLGLDDVVSSTILSVDHGRRKPHPSLYQAALDDLGVAADRAAFVGDSFEPDYLGPRNVGIEAFQIDPTGRHRMPSAHRLHAITDIEGALDGR